MSDVLSEEKKRRVIALGKLGWSLRRIEEATGVRRETASAYLKTAGAAAPARVETPRVVKTGFEALTRCYSLLCNIATSPNPMR